MADVNLNNGVLINTSPKQIVITVIDKPGQRPNYEIAHSGFISPDARMLMHEVIMHLLNVVSDTNNTMVQEHYEMICKFAMQHIAPATMPS